MFYLVTLAFYAIIIYRENVTNGKLYNFAKRTWGEIINMNIPYDLGSDMHYGAKVTIYGPAIPLLILY